ncbi:MAG: SusE domain-containing protein [Ekhidna sp.]
MKNNIILSILALSIVVLGCEEDIERPILDADNAVSTPASFTSAATADAKVITLETLADTFEVFKWDPIVYGVDIAVNYTLELSATEDFSGTISNLITTRMTEFAITNSTLNDFLVAAEYPVNEQVTFYLRLKSVATNPAIAAVYSDVITRVVTTFAAIPDPLYFVGPGTAAGWDNAGTFGSLFPDAANPKQYYYRGRFSGEWKLIVIPGSWAEQWGPGDGQPNNANGVANLSDNAPTWNMPEGYYDFSFNLSTSAYTIATYDASGDATYTAMGIIGDAIGGWDDGSELDMVQSTFDPHIWKLENVVFTDNIFKFRPDDNFDLGYGTSGSNGNNGWPAGQTIQSGTSAALGAKPGTYDVWFNDISGRFFMIEND